MITADPQSLPDFAEIEAVIKAAGYSITDGACSTCTIESPKQKWLEIGGALLIIFALGKLLDVFDLVSLAPSTSGALTFGGILLIGLVAGTSSCLAVTGGLLLTLAAKHTELAKAETSWQKLRPLLHFNIGRILSYFILGGLVGLLGTSLTFSSVMTGYLNIAIALIMLYLAFTILHILPKGSFPLHFPKSLSRRITNLSESNHPLAPFALGAFTFFLPCGFTQSLQLVALASGSFMTGALTMFIFALGTLPSLLGLSFLSSHTEGRGSRLFLRFAGALVLVLAFFNLQSGLALAGFHVPIWQQRRIEGPLPGINAEGMQDIFMRVTSGGYEPSVLTVKAGIPVRWTIDGSGARGCTSMLSVPSMNILRPLTAGLQTIEFTPTNPGSIVFSCSMGMVRGEITVL
jgi:sulfite exporter TauE/SafE